MVWVILITSKATKPEKNEPNRIMSKITVQEIIDCGSLHNLAAGEFIRPATEAEAKASEAAGDTGAILVDGLICYVQP